MFRTFTKKICLRATVVSLEAFRLASVLWP
jgi:hypothetical protein